MERLARYDLPLILRMTARSTRRSRKAAARGGRRGFAPCVEGDVGGGLLSGCGHRGPCRADWRFDATLPDHDVDDAIDDGVGRGPAEPGDLLEVLQAGIGFVRAHFVDLEIRGRVFG